MKIFPSAQEAIITTAILSFIFGLCSGALLLSSGLEWKDYISSLATLIAAFSGAWLAFYLTNRARVRQENETKYMQLNKALFILLRQINAVEGFGQEIDKFPEDEKLAFMMPAYKENDYYDLKLDFDGLAFLSSTKYTQDLFNLTIEQERFEQVLESLRIRHKHYQEKVMPEMIASGLTDRKANLEEYIRKLSVESYKGAIQGAKQMRSEINAYRESSLRMHKRLNSLSKELFPGRGFIEVSL